MCFVNIKQKFESITLDVGNNININWLIIDEKEHNLVFCIGCVYRNFKNINNDDIRLPIYFTSNGNPYENEILISWEIDLKKYIKKYTETPFSIKSNNTIDPIVYTKTSTCTKLNKKINDNISLFLSNHNTSTELTFKPQYFISTNYSTISGLVLFLIFLLFGVFLFFFQKFIVQL